MAGEPKDTALTLQCTLHLSSSVLKLGLFKFVPLALGLGMNGILGEKQRPGVFFYDGGNGCVSVCLSSLDVKKGIARWLWRKEAMVCGAEFAPRRPRGRGGWVVSWLWQIPLAYLLLTKALW